MYIFASQVPPLPSPSSWLNRSFVTMRSELPFHPQALQRLFLILISDDKESDNVFSILISVDKESENVFSILISDDKESENVFSILISDCYTLSPRGPYEEYKRMVLEHTHGLFIT